MNIYTVTTIDQQRKRHRYTAIARNWFEAWREASELYGIARLVMVKPWRAHA